MNYTVAADDATTAAALRNYTMIVAWMKNYGVRRLRVDGMDIELQATFTELMTLGSLGTTAPVPTVKEATE
jgi:hypothetical protein